MGTFEVFFLLVYFITIIGIYLLIRKLVKYDLKNEDYGAMEEFSLLDVLLVVLSTFTPILNFGFFLFLLFVNYKTKFKEKAEKEGKNYKVELFKKFFLIRESKKRKGGRF